MISETARSTGDFLGGTAAFTFTTPGGAMTTRETRPASHPGIRAAPRCAIIVCWAPRSWVPPRFRAGAWHLPALCWPSLRCRPTGSGVSRNMGRACEILGSSVHSACGRCSVSELLSYAARIGPHPGGPCAQWGPSPCEIRGPRCWLKQGCLPVAAGWSPPGRTRVAGATDRGGAHGRRIGARATAT